MSKRSRAFQARIRNIEAARAAARQRERTGFQQQMTVQHGAPEECELTPFECVLLRQSIAAAGNEVPAWIVSASNSWLWVNGYKVSDLRPPK